MTESARHILYAYVDGNDLQGVVSLVMDRLAVLVRETPWRYLSPHVVNQRHEAPGTGDLPDWDLGLNAALPEPGDGPAGWFADAEHIARYLGELTHEIGRSFVIGIAEPRTGMAEDLFSVDSASPDVRQLRAIIGVEPNA